MSDARLHAAAIEALVEAAVTCHRASAPNNAAPPYVILHADQGHGRVTSYAADTDHLTFTFQTTSVGVTDEQAKWAADKARGAVEDVRPTVSGWSCRRIRQVDTQPVDRDDKIDPPLFYAVDVWQYIATPSA